MCNTQEHVEEFDVGHLKVSISRDDNAESPRDWYNVGTMICWSRRYSLGDKHSYGEPDNFWYDLFKQSEPTDEEIRGICLEGIRDESFREQYVSHLYGWRGSYETIEVARYDFIVDCIDRDWLGKDTKGKIGKVVQDRFCILPLYLYSHSGVTMNTTGFSCPWDSGRVGYIYAKLSDAKRQLFGEGEEPTDQEVYEKTRLTLVSEVKTYDEYLCGDVFGYSVEDAGGVVYDSLYGIFGLDWAIKEAKESAEAILKTLNEDIGGGI